VSDKRLVLREPAGDASGELRQVLASSARQLTVIAYCFFMIRLPIGTMMRGFDFHYTLVADDSEKE